jgi:hypothetical protein
VCGGAFLAGKKGEKKKVPAFPPKASPPKKARRVWSGLRGGALESAGKVLERAGEVFAPDLQTCARFPARRAFCDTRLAWCPAVPVDRCMTSMAF